MKIITNQEIENLGINPAICHQWVQEAFKMKYDCQLPAKMSVHPQGIDFYTTMPCLLPERYDFFSAKVVSRIVGRKPALKSDLMLFRASTGELLAIMDGDWITSMRTGAVAALAIQTFQKSDAQTYGILGLGNTAHATMKVLASLPGTSSKTIKLLKYKDQAEKFIQDFRYTGIRMEIVESIEDIVASSDVVLSCITETTELLCPKDALFNEGVLVVPVHTRGFQNCDLFFDKVYADDTDHVKGFKYFSKFKQFDELSHVLLGQNPGRENDKQRILAYNIGLGLHDAYFAYKIYELLQNRNNPVL